MHTLQSINEEKIIAYANYKFLKIALGGKRTWDIWFPLVFSPKHCLKPLNYNTQLNYEVSKYDLEAEIYNCDSFLGTSPRSQRYLLFVKSRQFIANRQIKRNISITDASLIFFFSRQESLKKRKKLQLKLFFVAFASDVNQNQMLEQLFLKRQWIDRVKVGRGFFK